MVAYSNRCRPITARSSLIVLVSLVVGVGLEIRGAGASTPQVPLCSLARCLTYFTHTHTHPFNGPLTGTTQVIRYQKGKTNLDFTGARDSEWQWHQLDDRQVCPSCRPTNSVKALECTSNIRRTLDNINYAEKSGTLLCRSLHYIPHTS